MSEETTTPIEDIKGVKQDYNQVMQLQQVVTAMGQQRHPFGIGISKNIKILEALVTPYNEKREALIDKYAVRDEEGNFVGAMIPNPDAKDDNDEPKEIRVASPQKVNEIEWNDKDAFLTALNDLGQEQVQVSLSPINCEKKYLDTKANIESTIGDYVDRTFEGSLILYLNTFGFWSGLDL